MSAIGEVLLERCGRFGSLPFDEVMDLALYDPENGFYASGGQAGRRGDFVTSVEVGPLFGALVAHALDEWWVDMGRPDPFMVVEAGAGTGMLARTVLAAAPACAAALRYVLVERSAALRQRHGDHLPLTPPTMAFGPTVVDTDGIERPAVLGEGPVVVSLAELPTVEGPVVVLANELLDNLAFRVMERSAEGWQEVRVAGDAAGRLVELPVPAGPALAALADRLAAEAPLGSRVPVQEQAARWLRDALELASSGGRVVVFDYSATTLELAGRPWRDWLRTYADHQRGTDPLDRLGEQDITTDVCVDQLARVQAPDLDRSQTEWLRAHGIEAMVEQGRAVWAERAHLGDLEAMRARSSVGEAEALCDPGGLGAFRVLEWST